MRTVVVTPWRPNPRRQHLWDWVRGWIADNYGFPVFTADSDGAVFSAAQARNRAAALAGDWDVALFHDADTFAHPVAVERAVKLAASSSKMVVSADSHMYCDKASTNRMLSSGDAAFARPASFDNRGVYERPCSGIVAVGRDTFEAVGGYVESLEGWGYEDLVFLQCCNLFAGGHTWVDGHINLHLWHEPSPRDQQSRRNEHVWKMLANYRRLGNVPAARKYLAGLGHRVP